MHGLQTIQAVNAAAIYYARQKALTPVGDTIPGFFVFFPNGYEVVYHTAAKLPEHPERALLAIEFKGETAEGTKFDVTPASGPQACNQSLDSVLALADIAGVPVADVEKRLTDLFILGLSDEIPSGN